MEILTKRKYEHECSNTIQENSKKSRQARARANKKLRREQNTADITQDVFVSMANIIQDVPAPDIIFDSNKVYISLLSNSL